MPKLLLLLLAGVSYAFASSPVPEESPAGVVQQLFDAMSAHDAEAAAALFVPNATLVSVRPDGKSANIPYQDWIDRLRKSQDRWLERMWNPKILEHGAIAVVWAEYDFHLNGKFGHCGIDSFNLLRTGTGWKIAGVMFTSETQACSASPLGPPSR